MMLNCGKTFFQLHALSLWEFVTCQRTESVGAYSFYTEEQK